MGGPSSKDEQTQRDIAQENINLANSANARSDKLFGLTFPGLSSAENYYQMLASGDPTAIFRAIAPATEQINQQSAAAKERIETEMPRGGEQRLAEENLEISKSSQVGRLATTAYTSSFPALATLAGQGVGLSLNEVSSAISALSGASSATNSVMQADASSKAATMGFLGSVVGGGAEVGAAALMPAPASSGCWIAEAIYGVDDQRTHDVRRWLNTEFKKTRFGTLVMSFYLRFGERIAAWVRRSTLLKASLKPLFDKALERARA